MTSRHFATLIVVVSIVLLAGCSSIKPRPLDLPLVAKISSNEKTGDTEQLNFLTARGARKVHSGHIRLKQRNECEFLSSALISIQDKKGFINHWELSPVFDFEEGVTLTLDYLGRLESAYQYQITINDKSQVFTSTRPIANIESSGKSLDIVIGKD